MTMNPSPSHPFCIFLKKMFKLSFEVIILNTNKKEMERQNRQKNLNEFNSITHKKEPENQNHTHNIRSEAVEPKNRQV